MNRKSRAVARTDGHRRVPAAVDSAAGLLLRAGALSRLATGATDDADVESRRPARGYAPGYDLDRVLIVGAGLGKGRGAPLADDAVCTELALAISRATHRGCEVEQIADRTAKLSGITPLLAGHQLDRWDVLILATGLGDALQRLPLSRWRDRLNETIGALLPRTAATAEVIVVGIPRVRSLAAFDSPLGGVAERHARRLDQATQIVCDAAERVSYVPISPNDDGSGHGGPEVDELRPLDRLAEVVSDSLARHYEVEGDRRRPRPIDSAPPEPPTDTARDGSPLAGSEIADALSEIRTLAKRAFQIEGATASLWEGRGGPILWIAGEGFGEPRDARWYECALAATVPLIVLDTLEDERFRDEPMVTGEPRPRFFAAIPIDDPEEGRLGTICVFDSSPRRRIDDIDPDQVRLLSETVQREFPRILAASRADASERRPGRIE